MGGIYERNVGKRLWEVADESVRPRIVLLREQSHIVAQAEQAFEEPACVVEPVHEHVGVSQPKTTCQECALATGQAIVAGLRIVSEQKPVDEQAILDRRDRATDTRIARRQEPDRREEQETRIEFLRTVRLDEAADLPIE